jgi:hypothetical protein
VRLKRRARQGRRLSDADLLRLDYNLACGLANRALDDPLDSTSRPIALGSGFELSDGRVVGDLAAAEELAVFLLRRSLRFRHFAPGEDGGVAELAEGLVRPVMALLSGVWAVARTSERSAVEHAMTFNLLAMDEPVHSIDTTHELERELEALLDRAEERPHADLVELLGEMPELESPATAYSIACYHSVLAEGNEIDGHRSMSIRNMAHADGGFRALSIAIVDRTYKTWASDDPWLKVLKDWYPERWVKLFPAPPAPKEPETLNVDLGWRASEPGEQRAAEFRDWLEREGLRPLGMYDWPHLRRLNEDEDG